MGIHSSRTCPIRGNHIGTNVGTLEVTYRNCFKAPFRKQLRNWFRNPFKVTQDATSETSSETTFRNHFSRNRLRLTSEIAPGTAYEPHKTHHHIVTVPISAMNSHGDKYRSANGAAQQAQQRQQAQLHNDTKSPQQIQVYI